MKIVNDGEIDISYSVSHQRANQPQKYGVLNPREETNFVCYIAENELIINVASGNMFETGNRKVSVELLKRVTTRLNTLYNKTRSKEMKKTLDEILDEFPTIY